MDYVRERRAVWDRIHEELKLLPRCPEHDTVRFLFNSKRDYIKRGSVLVFSSLSVLVRRQLPLRVDHLSLFPPLRLSGDRGTLYRLFTTRLL